MAGAQIITHQGKKIVYIDLSNCMPDSIPIVIEESKAIIKDSPYNSVFTLTNVTGLHFDPPSFQLLKEWTEFNKPYVKSAAIIGVKGMLKTGLLFINQFSHREIKVFDEKEEALDWLVAQ